MANKVTMSICGQEYTLVADESAEYMKKVGALVDQRMDRIQETLHVSQADAAVLAAVNLADELLKNQAAAENLRRQVKNYLDEATQAKNEASELTPSAVQGPAGPGPMTELLSPAGGWEAMVAAVQNGADAVYMGFGGLNARRSARNFTDEEFRAAVAYCHLRGVKVYLTLNTLLTDRELPAAAQAAARRPPDMGVDAVLIQDWGVWRLAREAAPDASPPRQHPDELCTRLGGACRAAELGLERVVLARELTRRDIAAICPGLSRGDRGLCPRGPVHVLLRSVRDERRYRRTQRQPGGLRPALPPALRR